MSQQRHALPWLLSPHPVLRPELSPPAVTLARRLCQHPPPVAEPGVVADSGSSWRVLPAILAELRSWRANMALRAPSSRRIVSVRCDEPNFAIRIPRPRSSPLL